ncbi:hypothetical protein HXX76_015364 [Chlamydomonas incerta]|uniref:Uncharacterized protein n=1 Tax=Chlamydomonas incerta TaxID=51695 RepID=A0A835SAK9_CHLIN|nr:hypothetical protein HXX76_015364 [Chlamydomonas incerta]|eukprot:KAG2423399.1 hypothetical protein HXX76_015364 [Chlamydomonas incerta]
MSVDRGARAAADAAAGGALHKARMSLDRGTRFADASAGGRHSGQRAGTAHHQAPSPSGRRGVDPGGYGAASGAGPHAESREGLARRSAVVARYGSGAEYSDPALERCERSEYLGAAALAALRYSCTSTSFTAKRDRLGQQQAQRPAAGNRPISAPVPLAGTAPPNDARQMATTSGSPFQSTSSNVASVLLAARGSGYSRASDADSDASHHVRRSNSNGSGNVDTGFLQRLDEALASGALRPDQATRLLRDVGFDLDQLLVDELSAK